MDPFVPLLRALNKRNIKYVAIGVGGANSGGVVFKTDDRDLFLPPEADNLTQAWTACDDAGLEVWLTDDFTLVMKGFEFDTVWNERHVFRVEGVEIPTARLTHIVMSKQAAARPRIAVPRHAQRRTRALLKKKDAD